MKAEEVKRNEQIKQVERNEQSKQIEQTERKETQQEEGGLFEGINIDEIDIPEYPIETQINEEGEEFTIKNYNLLGNTIIGIMNALVILGFWTYAKSVTGIDITYSEVEKIVGLKATEKTELGKLLGRILLKREVYISEEIQFGISLMRIYAIQKYPAFLQYLNDQNKNRKKTARKRKKKEEKKKITVKDVLAESKK